MTLADTVAATAHLEPGTRAFRDHLVGLVRAMAPQMKARAVEIDRMATFPFENFADFRELGLLAVCVPRAYGGLGATYADYIRVSEEVGRYCGATGLTFNMHNATMLWTGQVSDLLDLSPADRDRHERPEEPLYAIDHLGLPRIGAVPEQRALGADNAPGALPAGVGALGAPRATIVEDDAVREFVDRIRGRAMRVP